MCNMEDFKFLADLVEHVPLELRARYVFCCAPIPKRKSYVCTMFLKVWYQSNTLNTENWFCWCVQNWMNLNEIYPFRNYFIVCSEVFSWWTDTHWLAIPSNKLAAKGSAHHVWTCPLREYIWCTRFISLARVSYLISIRFAFFAIKSIYI